MIQEIEEDCIVDGMEHQFEGQETSYGSTTFKCRFCSAIKFEYEDAAL